jgi:activating signal cointegrator complex subunit 2
MTAPLPLFPSSQARKGLSPSQNARLHESIALVLQTMLEIPTERLNVPATRAFIASYAKATAQDILEALVWDQSKTYQPTKHEQLIRLRTLQLVERSATIHGVMSLEIIADVAIAYAQRNASRVRNVWASCLRSQPTLLDSVRSDMIPSFNILLSPEQIAQAGLYSARKSVLCLSCMIHAAPPRTFIRG